MSDDEFADFDRDLERGGDNERKVMGRFLEEYAATRPASLYEQRQGIDCWVLNKRGEFSVQIKTDEQSARTGNAFIEVAHIHNELWIETGWLQRCEAHRLAYYFPMDDMDEPNLRNVLWLDPERLRAGAANWLRDPRRYKMGGRANRDYTTYGLLVPLDELRRLVEVFPE